MLFVPEVAAYIVNGNSAKILCVCVGIVHHLSHRRVMHKLLYTPLHEQYPTAEIMNTAMKIGFTWIYASVLGHFSICNRINYLSKLWVNCSLDSTIVTGGRSQLCFKTQQSPETNCPDHHLFCWESLLIFPFNCYYPNSQCTYLPRSKSTLFVHHVEEITILLSVEHHKVLSDRQRSLEDATSQSSHYPRRYLTGSFR